MSIHVDENAAHAQYSPSSAHRWTVCTASAEALARLPEQEEGEAAAKGTAAHSELERVLRCGVPDPDHESAWAVALAVSFVKQLPLGRIWIEERVYLSEQIWGRTDVGHWHDESATVTILDLKDGFVDVDVVENEQERIYAASLIQQFKLPAKWVRYVIVQPNSIAPGPRVKQWVEPIETLRAFVDKTVPIPSGPKQFVAGEHCRYCKLFGRCDPTKDLLAHLSVMLQHTVEELRPEQVAIVKALEKPIADWFKGLDKTWTKIALAKAPPLGMKLVQTVKHRAWNNEAEVRDEILKLHGPNALDVPTPSQVEKLGGIDVDALSSKPEGGPALAFESDRRPVWAPKTAAQMFAGVINAPKT